MMMIIASIAIFAAGLIDTVCQAYEQAAFEKGMKAGARLTMELLSINE